MRLWHHKGQAGRCGIKNLTGSPTTHFTEGYCALESILGRFLAFSRADRIPTRITESVHVCIVIV